MNRSNIVPVHVHDFEVFETLENINDFFNQLKRCSKKRKTKLTNSFTRCNIFVNPEITKENRYLDIWIKQAIV